jgi:adenosylcobinamide-GDP ribazoletransferase
MRPDASKNRAWNEMLASIGVLTALPVSSLPHRRSATLGLAPVVGVLLGLLAGGTALAGRWLFPGTAGAVLAAALTIAVLGLATRGLHLDGLADTADGFGPLGDPATGLAVMRRSDLGAFGAAVLVLTLLADCAALARDITLGRGFASVLVAVVAGRLAMTWAGIPGVPAARPDGLGASVAGSVPRPVAWALTGAALAGPLAPAAFGAGQLAVRLTGALIAGLGAGLLLRQRAVRRFGGITGDILGACCELAMAAALLVTAIR